MGMSPFFFAVLFFLAGPVWAQEPPPQSRIVLQEGGRALVQWDESHEAEIRFQTSRTTMTTPIQVVESTCASPLRPLGESRFDLRLVLYRVFWTKHLDSTLVGQSVRDQNGGPLSSSVFLSHLSGASEEMGSPLDPESIKIPGLGALMASSPSPQRWLKVVLEINNFANDETGENESRPFMTWHDLELSPDSVDTVKILANRRTVSLLEIAIPVLVFPIGETTVFLEEKTDIGTGICQIRLQSKASIVEIQNALLGSSKPDLSERPVRWAVDGVHQKGGGRASWGNFEALLLGDVK